MTDFFKKNGITPKLIAVILGLGITPVGAMHLVYRVASESRHLSDTLSDHNVRLERIENRVDDLWQWEHQRQGEERVTRRNISFTGAPIGAVPYITTQDVRFLASKESQNETAFDQGLL